MMTGISAPPMGTGLRKQKHDAPIRSYRNGLFDISLRQFSGRCDLVWKILVLIYVKLSSVSRLGAVLHYEGGVLGAP